MISDGVYTPRESLRCWPSPPGRDRTRWPRESELPIVRV